VDLPIVMENAFNTNVISEKKEYREFYRKYNKFGINFLKGVTS
jgi:hypothetical protein